MTKQTEKEENKDDGYLIYLIKTNVLHPTYSGPQQRKFRSGKKFQLKDFLPPHYMPIEEEHTPKTNK